MPDHASRMDPARLIELDGFSDRCTSRLLGVTMALAGEVFVLKAEVQRLRAALEAAGTVSATALQAQEETPALQEWLAQEQSTFAAELLRPWLDPDPVPDVRRFMAAE